MLEHALGLKCEALRVIAFGSFSAGAAHARSGSDAGNVLADSKRRPYTGAVAVRVFRQIPGVCDYPNSARNGLPGGLQRPRLRHGWRSPVLWDRSLRLYRQAASYIDRIL